MFTGLSAFPLTPAYENGSVDTKALGLLLDRLVDAKVDSVGLLGSTGTYMFLTREERRRAVETAREVMAGKLPLIVGVGAMRTTAAVELAQDAAQAGADALLLAPVSYTPLTDEEVYHHFIAVADATDVPLCIYSNPGTTNFSFSNDLIARLSVHPQIRGIKMPLAEDMAREIASLRGEVPDDFALGYSADWGVVPAMQAGADVFFSAVGGVLPKTLKTLADAAQANDTERLKQLEPAIQPLWDLIKTHGGLRVSDTIARHYGLITTDLPLPLRPLSGAARHSVIAALEAVLD